MHMSIEYLFVNSPVLATQSPHAGSCHMISRAFLRWLRSLYAKKNDTVHKIFMLTSIPAALRFAKILKADLPLAIF